MSDPIHNPMNEPRYCGSPTFMRTPLTADLNDLDIALVGVPYDGAVEARSGARQGLRQIRDMSSMMRAIHHVTRINPYELCRISPSAPYKDQEQLTKYQPLFFYALTLIHRQQSIAFGLIPHQ